jgi:phosphatidate cytidylyltransferase
MHLHRWITAIIALPVLIYLIAGTSIGVFTVVIAAVSLVGLREYTHIVFHHDPKKYHHPISLLGYISALAMAWSAYLGEPQWLLAVIALNLMAAGMLSVFKFKSDAHIANIAAVEVMGIVYVALPMCLLALIRSGTDGVVWIFLILAMIFAGDTAAYYVGSYWGRRKLSPTVSPKKTVEGALGGIAANIVVGLIFKIAFLPSLPWVSGILFFAVAGAAGQIGDLFESVLKRTNDIKDSGRILPGHGGILDRIDALLFATPVAYGFGLLIAG